MRPEAFAPCPHTCLRTLSSHFPSPLLVPRQPRISTSGPARFSSGSHPWLTSAPSTPAPKGEEWASQLRFLPCPLGFPPPVTDIRGGLCGVVQTQRKSLGIPLSWGAEPLPQENGPPCLFLQLYLLRLEGRPPLSDGLPLRVPTQCLSLFFRALFSQMLGRGSTDQRFITSSFWQV